MPRIVITPADAYRKGYARGRKGKGWARSLFDLLNPFYDGGMLRMQQAAFRDGLRDQSRHEHGKQARKRRRNRRRRK
jgi:hypothetical protein